jgi:hypothetical protein
VRHAALASLAWHAVTQAAQLRGGDAAAAAAAATTVGECGVLGCGAHPAGSAAEASSGALTLRGVLDALPPLYAVHNAQRHAPLLPATPPHHAARAGMHSLPPEVLLRVLRCLDAARDLRAATCTCRTLAALSTCIAPGLRVSLHPHQVAALAWMARREAAHNTFPSPLLLAGEAATHGGADDAAAAPASALPFVVDACAGRLLAPWCLDDSDADASAAALAPADCRGGLFCDEPGMGKTVSTLALVLRTRGTFSCAPPGARTGREACGAAWYEHAEAARRGAPARAQRVYLSCATLVVVPINLRDHWLEQAALHCAPHEGALRVALFDGARSVTAAALSRCDIVLTTLSRLSAAAASPHSPLRAVRWLRIVLDEGHALGSSGITARNTACCALHGERRWILSGTPAPERAGVSLPDAAARLAPLLAFLRCPLYGTPSSWNSAVRDPLRAGRPEGLSRLRGVLSRLMARATKADLRGLPPCVRATVLLDFEPTHAESYNKLVLFKSRALFLADVDDAACKQSLLHAKRADECRKTVALIRLACCVTGVLSGAPDAAELAQAKCMLGDASHPGWQGVSPGAHEQPRWTAPSAARVAACEAAWRTGGACDACGQLVPITLVTPCAHILCLACARSSRYACPVGSCGAPYAMQRMRDDAAPVPQDLIELQPSVTHKWEQHWQSTCSTKVSHVLGVIARADPGAWEAARERAARRRSAVAASARDVEEEALAQAEAAAPPQPPPLPDAPPAAPQPVVLTLAQRSVMERKRFDAAVRALASSDADDALSRPAPRPDAPRPPKFILFSDFLEHLRLVATHLAASGVRFAWLVSAECDAAARRRHVAAFKRDPSCNVLLMDKAGALGHDLSVASHVFLLEPMADAAEEAQVISRAHRMGCTAAEVRVETLAMRGTAEETLLRLRDEQARGGSGSYGAPGGAPGGASCSIDDTPDAAAAPEDCAAASMMQARSILRALAFVRPVQDGVGDAAAAAATATSGDAYYDGVSRLIEHILLMPGESAKLADVAVGAGGRGGRGGGVRGSGRGGRGGRGGGGGGGQVVVGPPSPEQLAPPPRSIWGARREDE